MSGGRIAFIGTQRRRGWGTGGEEDTIREGIMMARDPHRPTHDKKERVIIVIVGGGEHARVKAQRREANFMV